MKRDNELIRKILFAIEDKPSDDSQVISIDGYDDEVVFYHVKLLSQAGFLTAQDVSDLSGEEWWPGSLTYAGHDFLDNIRNDTVWSKTMELIRTKGVSIGLGTLAALVQAQLIKYLNK